MFALIIKFYYDFEVDNGDLDAGIVCHLFSQPVILILTNKKDYSSIEFYQNDVLIKTIEE